jgi:alpha-mannosidase
MQRFVWAQNTGIVTLGLNDYQIYKNTLSITLLRSIGLISNPKNPARLVPAGPPLEIPDAQCLGPQHLKFALCQEALENMPNLADCFYGVVAAAQNAQK